MENICLLSFFRGVFMRQNQSQYFQSLTNMTLKEYVLKEFVPYQKSKGQKRENLNKTIRTIEIILENPLCDKLLIDLNANHIEMILNSLKTERHLSKATINRYRSALLAIFNHAIRARVLDFNPVVLVKRHAERPRKRVLTIQEIEDILYYCKHSQNKELYTIVMIAINTGMRLNEIMNLKKSEIKENKIYLSADRHKSGYQTIIPLNTTINSVLKGFIRQNSDETTDRVFKTKFIKRSFRTAVNRAEVEDCRFHDLRRTFATHLMEKNTPLYVIKTLLGHSSIAITEHYLHCSENKSIQYVEKLNLPV